MQKREGQPCKHRFLRSKLLVQQLLTIYLRHLQTAYLVFECGVHLGKVAEITGYAFSTVRTYANKYMVDLDEAKKYFAVEPMPVVAYTKHCCRQGKNVELQYLMGCGEDVPGDGVVYLFKFYEPNKNIISSKIGTTTRSIKQRLPEEIAKYIKDNGWDINRVEICKIMSTKGITPTLVESSLRSEFGIDYGDSFVDNDRFMGVDLPTEQFTEIVNKYLRRKGKIK